MRHALAYIRPKAWRFLRPRPPEPQTDFKLTNHLCQIGCNLEGTDVAVRGSRGGTNRRVKACTYACGAHAMTQSGLINQSCRRISRSTTAFVRIADGNCACRTNRRC